MDKPTQDKATPDGANASPAEKTSAPAPEQSGEKSWGDKYKTQAFHFVRNVGVNFIINFGISALGTYALEKSPAEKYIQAGVDKVAKAAVKMGAHPKLGGFLGDFLVRTQLLLCGGHILLPPLKSMHDHRQKLQFELGHKLDVLQKSLGRGNAATERNLSEYKYIKDLVEAKPAQLSPDDKALLNKNHIGDNLQFEEKPETWKHVLTARSLGVAFTTTLSAVLAVGSYLGEKKGKPWMDVKQTYLKGVGGKFGKKSLNGMGLKDPGRLGELIVLELIYTLASKVGFDHMEHRMLKKEEAKKAAEAEAKLARDKERLQQAAAGRDEPQAQDAPASRPVLRAMPPSALEARSKLVEEGGKDFRTREAAKPAEASIAMS